MRSSAVRLVLAAAFIVSQAAAEEWPAFRGPRGDGHAQAAGLPLEWSATRNVAWSVDLPGEGWSSPAIVGGRVYLTAAVKSGPDDYDRSLRVLCLETAGGKRVWDTQVFAQTAADSPKKHQKASHANPTPIVHGDRVYVHFGHQGSAALTLDGKIAWANRELRYQPTHGNGGSPILVDDLLIFSCDGVDLQAAVALDAATGALRWKSPRLNNAGRAFSFSTPTLIQAAGRRQVVSPASEYVMAYDPTTGRELWRVRYPGGYSVIPKPVFAHGLVFVCSGYNKPVLHAIRPDGAGDVTKSHVVWTVNRDVPHTPSLLAVGDELYMVADRGIASCLDARTGKVHWSQRLGGNFSASPVLADGRIHFQSEEGVTTVVQPGKLFRSLAVNDLGERTLASMAVAEGAIFIRTEQRLYRIQSR
jgi:outer membrane protein assembly factor BamB